jgi:hypothetical protein
VEAKSAAINRFRLEHEVIPIAQAVHGSIMFSRSLSTARRPTKKPRFRAQHLWSWGLRNRAMVARTLPFKRDKPNKELPSISDEMHRQIEADQKDIKKQLKHAQQQLDLTNIYPGRKGDTQRSIRR